MARARSASLAMGNRSSQANVEDLPTPPIFGSGDARGLTVDEEEDESYFPTGAADGTSSGMMASGEDTPTSKQIAGFDPSLMMSYGHDPSLLVSRKDSKLRRSNSETMLKRPSEVHEPPPSSFGTGHADPGPTSPIVQQAGWRSPFDFAPLEEFAVEERKRLGINVGTEWPRGVAAKRAGTKSTENGGSTVIPEDAVGEQKGPFPTMANQVDTDGLPQRQRRYSGNAPQSRRPGGKLALFESANANANLPPFGLPPSASPMQMPPPSLPPPDPAQPALTGHVPPVLPPPVVVSDEEAKPYRFSFYSNNIQSTIHARSLCELPADGQTFEELFLGKISPARSIPLESGINGASATPNASGTGTPSLLTAEAPAAKKPRGNSRYSDMLHWKDDHDANSWWMDILSPTDEEMRVLSKCFGIHPLTAEDIQMEETREKIELFRNYYLVCFRSFDQDPYSPTYLEPINYYVVVFREGILSFHFRQSPHPQNVRRRIKQLKDYISVTSDWISYALIDDITDAFGPLIQSIEYEVDSIDELVLILKEAEQSDMLRRIGTCRKKVMGLLRLMGNKADVVKGLAKRCNENWSMAPKSDIGLYLSDIQDHLITMTQSLNHYEKLLSRSHSNYLAQISIEMTDANNQINEVLSRLTALGTILIPMNLITGLWGMNVHVPGQDAEDTTYYWFIGIICALVAIGGIGSFGTYRLMRRGRKRR